MSTLLKFADALEVARHRAQDACGLSIICCLRLIAEVIDRALDALVRQLEKQKFGATCKPRKSSPRTSVNPRHIPAAVKRAVWQRDRGQCSFVSQTGHRCGSRKRLEFDHIDPVARGGEATVEGIRLLCRAHNQYEAERVLGTGFMNGKREQARNAMAAARSRSKPVASMST